MSIPQLARRLVIGIDPGATTGFAVYSRQERKLIRVESTDFWGAIERVKDYARNEVTVIVEVAHHAPTFRHLKAEGQNVHTLSKIARNIGHVTREAQLLVEGLRRLGYEVAEVKPLGKAKKAEDDRRQFERLTGWTERTSQHGRDAGRLAFGV